MLTSWSVILIALLYVGLLFGVATYGDKKLRRNSEGHNAPRPLIYALSLAVYCTSWTFFGSVGLSARTGYDFLPIYIGPILMFGLAWPVIRMIVRVSKRENITSIADFISSRYGKNQGVGALVTLIAVIGITPYISLQLKAISVSLHTILPASQPLLSAGVSGASDNFALLVTASLAGFAMLFGTRHIDTTEHQDGLILAVAVESVIKLIAFLVVGIFVTFWLLGGLQGLLETVAKNQDIGKLFTGPINVGRWITMTVLSSLAIFLLPRQFHVSVVENTSLSDVKRAAWMFPLYLVIINIFVAPIAIAGLATFPGGSIDADTFVLALPVKSGDNLVALVAFIGGLSAATAMVIVETIALSIMVCNNLVVPFMLKQRAAGGKTFGEIGPLLLMIRRTAIVVVLGLAYGYYLMISSSEALARIGLLSFAAAAQFGPALLLGLIWKRGTSRGAMAGLLVGFGLWTYTLALPLFAEAGWLPGGFIENGPFGLAMLKPQSLLGSQLEPLTHGVLWSLVGNLVFYVLVSLTRAPRPLELAQANAFVMAELHTSGLAFRHARAGITVGQLEETVARYLGKERTRRSFDDYAAGREIRLDRDARADGPVMRFGENLLARAVGSSSSRLVLALLLESHSQNPSAATRLLDDASEALRHNRDLLQSAIDHVRQGIAVFDHELNLICWNRQFRILLGLPKAHGRVGISLSELMRQVLARNGIPDHLIDREVEARIEKLATQQETYHEVLRHGANGAEKRTIEVSSSDIPDGGIVVTFADITDAVDAQNALERANETLEKRVIERTKELTMTNAALEQARSEAEAANIGKTRFVAAASHDILQPLNAAKLFASSLVERTSGRDLEQLAQNVDASLEAVEEILNALLEISKLDAGAMHPEISDFPLRSIFDPLRTELSAIAESKDLKMTIMDVGYYVRSDRRLLRRQIQNLISNAIKYTPQGRILVGCRRSGSDVRIDVIDTGPGIPGDKQDVVFQEFTRLERSVGNEPGLGLGLSIVRRIAKVLGQELTLRSTQGHGSRFSIRLPLAVARPIPLKPARQKQQIPLRLGRLNVLVIDNDEKIIQAMTTLLSGWGCQVISAQNTEEALASIHETGRSGDASFDIILADYHLDDGDGLTLIRQLRAQLGMMLPAVLITADRSRMVIEAAEKNGVGYLRKPVKPAGLRAAISHVLSHMQVAE